MDQHKIEHKYFLNTLPRNTFLKPVVKAELPFHEHHFTIDVDLLDIRVAFVYDWAGLTFISRCTVRGVNPDVVRGLGGELETIVQLERSDGTMCEIGLNMFNYRRKENEELDFVWFVDE